MYCLVLFVSTFLLHFFKSGLDSLHTHSMQQAVRQVSQKGIKKQEESICNKHNIQLLKMECHIVQD